MALSNEGGGVFLRCRCPFLSCLTKNIEDFSTTGLTAVNGWGRFRSGNVFAEAKTECNAMLARTGQVD